MTPACVPGHGGAAWRKSVPFRISRSKISLARTRTSRVLRRRTHVENERAADAFRARLDYRDGLPRGGGFAGELPEECPAYRHDASDRDARGFPPDCQHGISKTAQ